MKKLFTYSWIFILLAFAACNIVENPHPAKKKEEPVIIQPTDSTLTTVQKYLDSLETVRGIDAPVKKVLLEDYTGHTCGNCPRAAEIASALKAQYKEKLVVMAVHIGFFAKTKNDATGKYAYDFTTDAGDEFDLSYNIDSRGLPQGMVNRTSPPGSADVLLPRGAWSGAVANEMAKAPVFNLTLTNVYNAATRKVEMKVRSEALAALPGNYKLGVYLVEDSIVNWQKDYDKTPADIQNYVHRHALRTDVNGIWGEAILQEPAGGQVISRYYDFTLDNSWVAENCSLVAFIYDETTKEVLQAEEQHLEID